MPMNQSQPNPTERALLVKRRQAVARQSRRRIGLLRGLGRSNRLFPRKLTVTREGKWIIAIALLLGIGAVNTGNNLLYLVLSLLISIITISGILSEITLRDVSLERAYPQALVAGEAALLRVVLHNRKPRAAFSLEVSEVVDGHELSVRPGHVLHLSGHESGQCFQVGLPRRRGLMATSGLAISTTYPFGFARKSRVFDLPAPFVVLPPVAAVDLGAKGSGARGEQERARRVGHGSEFRGLRDARSGDALRDIHWKVSARRDRLIAREWEDDATRVVVVAFVHLDPDPAAPAAAPVDATCLDGACATVAGLCNQLLEEGMSVGLRTLAGAVSPASDADGSGGQLGRIRHHLATLLPADRPPPAAWPLDDADWLEQHHLASLRAEEVAGGTALTMSPVLGASAWETWVVRFEDRRDVAVNLPGAAVNVLLERGGEISAIERPDDDPVAGAA